MHGFPDRSGGDRDVPPRVSIIIPSYNAANFLGATLESCRVQTWPGVEIIVVDDGSQDGTVAVARSFPEVVCITQANQGTSAARNAGIAVARGDFLVFLDHDDLLLPDAVRTGVAMFRDHPEASFVVGAAQLIDAEGGLCARQPTGLVPEGPVTYTQALYPYLRTPPALAMFRADLVRHLGGFDAELRCYGEDYDFYLRHLRVAPAWRHHVLVAQYRRHAGNASSGLPRMMTGILDVHARQRPEIADDPVLLAHWMAARRAWQYYYGRWLPAYTLRRLGHGDIPGMAAALKALAASTPGLVREAGSRLVPRIGGPLNPA